MLEEKQKSSLAKSICDCIEETINSKYGDNVAQVILNNFSARFGLKKTDIVVQPAKFEKLLEDIFGSGSACLLIKRSVVNELHRHFQIEIEGEQEKEDLNISRAINDILNNAY